MENKLVVFKGKEIKRTLYNNEWWFVIADVGNYVRVISCYHVSNRSQDLRQTHLPLRHPEVDIKLEEFLMTIDRRGFQGPIVLEYLPAYHDRLLSDALWDRRLLAV
jgi:hypothetical protein